MERHFEQDEVDFLVELYKLGAWQIINYIMKLLGPRDLCRICVVSKTWRQICHSDKAAWRKRTEFLKAVKLKLFKLGKENIGLKVNSHKNNPTPGSNNSVRSILSPLDINVTPVSTTSSPDPETPLPKGRPYRPCPQCHSPAIEVSPSRARCTSPQCTFDFCRGCFKTWHGDSGCYMHITSPGKNRTTLKHRRHDIIGGKQNKKRLKRL